MRTNHPRRNSWREFAITLTILLVGLASAAFGQGIVTGSISGSVVDAQQAVVSGAQVAAVQSGTNAEFKTVTDGQGFYSLRSLPLGTYTVTISAANFSTRRVANVSVQTGVNNALGVAVLAVGSNSEVVTVEASAPLIEPTTSQVSSTFETKTVTQLPNAGAGFDNLALYIPGVANNGSSNFSNTNGAALSSNGLRGRTNNFQIDGQSNNDNSIGGSSIFLSNPDVLSELQVVTNNFSAEYGRDSGSVVNYVTKSGSNAFHGSGFEYYTGSLFSSRANGEKSPLLGFCTAAQVIDPTAATGVGGCQVSKLPRSNENRFGGTIGGPIWRDKAWFFGSYQGDRQRSGQTPSVSSTLTPTPNGISQLAAAFPNNSAVKALQTIGPYAVTAGNPTPAGTLNNIPVTSGLVTVPVEFAFVSRSVTSLSNDRQITGRGDVQLSDKDRFFARYIYQQNISTAATGNLPGGGFVDIPGKDQQIGLDYTRTWSNRLVSQARFSYSRASLGFEGGGFPTCLQTNLSVCPTSISILGSNLNFGLQTNLPQGRLINNTQYVGNNTYVLGKHTVKFGGEFDRQRSPNVFLPSVNGGYTFSTFNDFISGNALSLSLADGPKSFNFKEKDLSFYGQDDWRVRDNITLNLGLRWEWNQQAVNLLHDITVANQAATPPFWDPTVPTSVSEIPAIPQALKNFGPNIGFAWTPRLFQSVLGQDKTVIRGGYRISYDPSYYNIFLNIATGAPVVNFGSLVGVGLPATGATGADVDAAFLPSIPRGGNPGTRNQSRVSTDFHQPRTQEWSLGIEHQVGNHIGLETRYVGNHVTGNFETINANPLLTGIPSSLLPAGVTPCATVGAPGFGRENCSFRLSRVRNNGAFSIYHGLQNRIDVRNLYGLTAGVEYTWSRAIDNVSEIFSSTGGISTPIAQNPFDPTVGERGVAAQSYPNVFTTYWLYDVPWKSQQQGLMGHVLGGWQWSGQFQYQTGAPITPLQDPANSACDTTFNSSFIGADSCRPIAGNSSAPFDSVGKFTSATNFINVSTGAVTTPGQVRFIVNNSFADANLCSGNPFACTVPRNIYRAQNRNNLNLGLQKSIKISERFNSQLRADMFNVFNRQFLGTPGLDINRKNQAGGSNFGTNALNNGTRRTMQLMLRVSF